MKYFTTCFLAVYLFFIPNFMQGQVIKTADSVIAPHQIIKVTFDSFPGNQQDWIALAVKGSGTYVQFLYLNGQKNGTLDFNGQIYGEYEMRGYYNNENQIRKTINFRIGNKDLVTKITPTQAVVKPNDSIRVTFSGFPGNDLDWISIATPGSNPSSNLEYKYLNKRQSGTLALSGRSFGVYELRGYFNNENVIRFQTQVVVGDQTLVITPDKPVFNSNESIKLNYSGFPGNPQDWISIAKIGTPPTSYVQYKFLNSVKSGGLMFDPVPDGEYELRGYVNNEYIIRVTTPVRVGNTVAAIQTPGILNIQGVLTNAAGQVVPNGSYSILFKLYNASQGGIALWEENQTNVIVQSGVFSVVLGKLNPFNIAFDKPYFLGIQFGVEAEMTPRVELTSTPYSLMAKNVENNSISTDKIQPNAVTLDKIAAPIVSSINGLSNDGGNINILAGANIAIVNDNLTKSITISAVNPGGGTGGISRINPGNAITVTGQDGPTTTISVGPNSITTTEIQNNAITTDKIAPNVLSSLSGVSNDGGNINLIAGNNISITPNDANKTITISAAGTGGGGTGTLNQLIEGNGIGIQNPFGPNTTIGLKPNILLGPSGSLSVLNQNSTIVGSLSATGSSLGGFLNISNGQGISVAGITTLSDGQPLVFLNSRLGRQVVDIKANEFSDGEINLKSVLTNTMIRLTSNDNAGGLINVFNSIGNIAAQLSSDIDNDGSLFLNSSNNVRVLDLSTNPAGGGVLRLFNVEGTEALRLTTFETYGGSVRVANRAGLVAARLNASTIGNGNLSIFNKNEQEAAYLSVNNNGGGFLGIRNGENSEVARLSTLPNSQPRLLLSNRLGGPVADLRANDFSDGDLQLYSVLNNPTVRITANDNAGGLINVFNQGGQTMAAILDNGNGGFIDILNNDGTEVITMGITTEDLNARIHVNNRLGNPSVELFSNQFSDGQLTLNSVLNNPTVIAGANDNAGGLINVFNKSGKEAAELTEYDGFGQLDIYNPAGYHIAQLGEFNNAGILQLWNSEKAIAAAYADSISGFGTFGVYATNGRLTVAELTKDEYDNGYIGLYHGDLLPPIVSIGGNDKFEGYLKLFNNKGLNTSLLGHNPFGDGYIELKNNLGNLGALFEALKDGGSVTVTDGKPGTNHRAVLLNGLNGGRLNLFNNQTKLVSVMSVGDNGEGLWQIVSKQDLTKNRLAMGGDNAGTGYLRMYNSLNNNTSFLGHDVLGNGSLEMRNNLGNLGGFFIAYTDGGRLAITDGSAANNHRGLLENALNGGKLSIYNKTNIPVDDITVANNGEGLIRIAARPDFSKSRLELGGDDAGSGFLRMFNSGLKKTGELITNGAGGELNIFNANAVNTSRLSHSTNGSGLLEIGTPSGNKVVRVTSSDGTGFIGVDNIDNLEVVRITANTGKGGGIALRNDKGFDMIKLTQDQSYGTILVNNAAGGVLTNITRNTANGGFVGTKDQNGKDAIWLTTGVTGGGHFNTFNSLGNAALTLNSNASNIGNVSVHGTAGNEIARVSGTSNGIGFVGIFNSGGFGLAGLTSNNTTLGGYIYAQTAAGKDVARMTTTSAGGGVIAINSPVGTAPVSYLTYNNQNGGYIGVATSAGNDRARITTNTGGSGIMSVSNTSGNDVVEATVSAANHGTVATYNASGSNIAGLLATTTGHGYIRAGNTSGNERASMSSGDLGGRVDVSDASGNVRVIMSAGGNMTVNDADGSYLSNYSTGSGVHMILVDRFQHPRAEVKSGIILAKGPNGIEHSFMSTTNGSNLGYIGVCNSNIVNSPVKAGMYTNNNNQGVLFADIKNFKIDYPGKPDKQIWYGSLEGPELAAYIRGTGKLINGKASIEFSDHYQKLANTGTMTVILTPLSGKSKGLAVVKKAGTGFEVEELLEGSGSYDFDWEVKCVRKGHEGFEVVRNKSDDPQPFRSESKLPHQLESRNTTKIEPDAIPHEKTTPQQLSIDNKN